MGLIVQVKVHIFHIRDLRDEAVIVVHLVPHNSPPLQDLVMVVGTLSTCYGRPYVDSNRVPIYLFYSR